MRFPKEFISAEESEKTKYDYALLKLDGHVQGAQFIELGVNYVLRQEEYIGIIGYRYSNCLDTAYQMCMWKPNTHSIQPTQILRHCLATTNESRGSPILVKRQGRMVLIAINQGAPTKASAFNEALIITNDRLINILAWQRQMYSQIKFTFMLDSNQETSQAEAAKWKDQMKTKTTDFLNPIFQKRDLTIRQFIDTKKGDEKEQDMILVMIKIIEEAVKQGEKGINNSYTPNHIFLNNLDIKNFDKLVVKFGLPITNLQDLKDGLYLAPEILAGKPPSLKSKIFNLGVIFDQLMHGSTFFKSPQEIQNMQISFSARGGSPILKNTLFEMIIKQPKDRLDIVLAKRRLYLLKYLTPAN